MAPLIHAVVLGWAVLAAGLVRAEAQESPSSPKHPSWLGRQIAQADGGNNSSATGEGGNSAANDAPASDEATEEDLAGDDSGGESKSAASKKPKKPPTILESILGGGFMPIILIVIVGYFLMFRPQQKKNAELNAMLKNLKKGDRVVTVGGIVGVVVNSQKDNDQVTLLIDEGTNAKIRVLRSHLARVLTDGDKGGEKDSAKSTSESAASEKSK